MRCERDFSERPSGIHIWVKEMSHSRVDSVAAEKAAAPVTLIAVKNLRKGNPNKI